MNVQVATSSRSSLDATSIGEIEKTMEDDYANDVLFGKGIRKWARSLENLEMMDLNICSISSGKRLQFANWKITMLSIGKSTINGPCSMAM